MPCKKFSSSASRKAANEEERKKALSKRASDAELIRAAEERMKSKAWHPSSFEKSRWACCQHKDLDDIGSYTCDDSNRNIISIPLCLLNGRY